MAEASRVGHEEIGLGKRLCSGVVFGLTGPSHPQASLKIVQCLNIAYFYVIISFWNFKYKEYSKN